MSQQDAYPYREYGPGHTSKYTILKKTLRADLKRLDCLCVKEGHKSGSANRTDRNKTRAIPSMSGHNRISTACFKWPHRILLWKHRVELEWDIIQRYEPAPGLKLYLKDLEYRFNTEFRSFQ